MYDSPNDNSNNGVFQLIGETSCSFITLTRQTTKTCILLTAFEFSEDMSGRSVLSHRSEAFLQSYFHHNLKAFRQLSIAENKK